MAYELLINGNPSEHLYRYDIESFFYVIFLLCCRYELVPLQNSPEHAIMARMKVPSRFDRWYKLNCAQLKPCQSRFSLWCLFHCEQWPHWLSALVRCPSPTVPGRILYSELIYPPPNTRKRHGCLR
ncbi:hypothetical protein ARMSODRAFT_954403 [Armillaria solidipes]|uniref:Fungal-type protein kinase domain-containing protein n=1 Tax=Armillaria solidipes TaxID=1076256 RepID=A0A2H3BL51_9AGAR|nr:hypothetical protein ARMSODRAFT_954403 [Armillaria solidipes]